MKYLHLTMALLFVVTASLQLNDPDPLYWLVSYLAVAVTAGLASFGRRFKPLSRVAIGLTLAGLMLSVSGTGEYFAAGDLGSITGSMSGDRPHIEAAREFAGLLVALIYLTGIQLLRTR